LDFYSCGYLVTRRYIRNMVESVLTLQGVTVQTGGVRLLEKLDWKIQRGEQWAIVGPSGAGKTVLAHTLMGLHFASGQIGTNGLRITMVEQQHRFRGRPGTTDLYYQQRFNSADAEATITVAEELAAAGFTVASEVAGESGNDWLDQLQVRALLTKPLIQLSNGENKRVQLAIALLEKPDLLIFDNPFLGLDVEGRGVLKGIIDGLAAGGMTIILITGERDIPACITHVGRLERGQWSFAGPVTAFRPAEHRHVIRLDPSILTQMQGVNPNIEETDPPVVICMQDVTIRYGESTILDKINWEVRQGERWSVSGPNGAGKSTLLSLITADNPQAYANNIRLFGRRRGTGETIWEIKQKIGFVSPELHVYFDPAASCFEVVASGLFDTIGLFRPLSSEQEETVVRWMKLLSLQDLRARRLPQLSAGQQRMILLARALIKNPPMLILDEPCQGLDDEQTEYFRELVSVLCETFEKTLIYVSHYRQELPRCIDRFLQLEGGRRME
jgi:molybdate transport system ATP-binding protein